MPVYSTFYANTLRLFSSSKAALVFRGHFDVKTDSPKQVVTIVHVTTISGHFLANPLNIFHTIEASLDIKGVGKKMTRNGRNINYSYSSFR